jgi:hypothetical protein
MKTLPGRRSLRISETTSSGIRRSSTWATPWANGLVISYVVGVLSGT